MQPTELTIPGLSLFALTILIIFAFNNPKGYKKVQNFLIFIIGVIGGGILGMSVYKAYILSKLSGETINHSTITYLFSFEGDVIFYIALTFLFYAGAILLERIHTLNDKNKKIS